MADTDSERPPSKSAQRLVWILGVVLLMAFATVVAPVILKQRKAVDRTRAISGIRQIGMSLFEFDNDYGSFPDDATAMKIPSHLKGGYKLTGDHSNAYFRQLIVVGLKSEQPFWCKTKLSPHKPDDAYGSSVALQGGEVGYSYIMRELGRGQSSSEDPGRVVVVAPSKNASADWTFDSEAYGGKAVALLLDNSATALSIREDNNYISIGGGRYLQTNGANTPWGKINPVLLTPEP